MAHPSSLGIRMDGVTTGTALAVNHVEAYAHTLKPDVRPYDVIKKEAAEEIIELLKGLHRRAEERTP